MWDAATEAVRFASGRVRTDSGKWIGYSDEKSDAISVLFPVGLTLALLHRIFFPDWWYHPGDTERTHCFSNSRRLLGRHGSLAQPRSAGSN